MQRPLYGLAVDLTPEAVIGPVPYMPPLATAPVGPAVPVQGAEPPSAAASPTPRPQRLPENQSDRARLVAAAIALGAMVMVPLMAALRSDPAPATAAQTASTGTTVASQPIKSVAATSTAKPPAQAAQALPRSSSSAPARTDRPTDPLQSRSEPADADLATTIERLREGIR